MRVFIVMSGCYTESIDSIWLSENKAENRAKERYHAHVISCDTED